MSQITVSWVWPTAQFVAVDCILAVGREVLGLSIRHHDWGIQGSLIAQIFMKKTNMLSWGFATEGMCVRGGQKLRKQITNKVNGAEKIRVSKRATVMQARKATVDLAALGSEERRIC